MTIPTKLSNHSIGRQIKKHREARNISQKELGSVLGVSYQQIQKYESGKNRISAAYLYHIALHMKVPITDFFVMVEDDGI